MVLDVGAGYAMCAHNPGELRWRKANIQVGVSVELFAMKLLAQPNGWWSATAQIVNGNQAVHLA